MTTSLPGVANSEVFSERIVVNKLIGLGGRAVTRGIAFSITAQPRLGSHDGRFIGSDAAFHRVKTGYSGGEHRE
jgi:hypothetical protein